MCRRYSFYVFSPFSWSCTLSPNVYEFLIDYAHVVFTVVYRNINSVALQVAGILSEVSPLILDDVGDVSYVYLTVHHCNS